MTFGKC